MYKKVSNIASREMIENKFGVSYKYPKLYQPNAIINGFFENSLSVITAENTNEISFGIWGLLPSNYQDDWIDFQNVLNTLLVSKEDLGKKGFFKEPFIDRRCLIIITGFFTSFLHNGTIYPFYVYMPEKEPFCIAGIYNTLEDGFISCSMLLTDADDVINKIENIDKKMPVIIPEKLKEIWLDTDTTLTELKNVINHTNDTKLKAHPVAKEFFKNDIAYESMLDPVSYKDIENV